MNERDTPSPAEPALPATSELPPEAAPRRELPKAKVAAPIRWLADLMRSSAKPPKQKGDVRGLRADGTAQAALPPIIPQDPEAVLGATKAVASVLGDIAGENKTIALVGGLVLLTGLGIFAVMKLSSASKKRRAGEQPKPPGPDIVDRYAAAMEAQGLQAPQYAGRRPAD